jgi:hypothetical protein
MVITIVTHFCCLIDVDKTAQQLYAMINYGEIWKKFSFRNDLKFDSKLKTHLNDMIFNGLVSCTF